MSGLHRFWRRTVALFRRSRREEDMAEEMRYHLARGTEREVAGGLDPKLARLNAARHFGGVEQIKERVRDERSFPWVEQLVQDFGYGLRILGKQPGFTLLTVAILGVGIGATTAIFSIVNGVVLRPLPYPESGRLVALFETQRPNHPRMNVSPGTYFAWQRESAFLESIALTEGLAFVLTGAGEPARRFGFKVTGDFFRVMGVVPFLGRTFDARDLASGQTQVTVLNYKFWKSQFEADPAVVGRKVRINSVVYTVIGVMPPSFYSEPMTDPWLFLPLVVPDNGSGQSERAVARLKPGVTPEQAESELTIVNAALPRPVGVEKARFGANVVPMLENQVGNVRPMLLILLGAVAALLLIACVNVASLLLARASARTREIAVRSVLGAGRPRIVRQLLCESLLLAGFGCVLGIALAFLSKDLLMSLAPRGLPRAGQVAIDGSALLFACGASALTGIAFGLVPALQASRVNLGEAMKTGTKGSYTGKMRLRSLLVVAEVALALVLFFHASLLVRSFRRLTEVDMGYEIGRGVSFASGIILNGERYDTPEKRMRFGDQVLARFGAVPGIEDIAFASAHPMFGSEVLPVELQDKPESGVVPANSYVVSPGYFHLFRIHLLAGRGFDAHDRSGSAPVAIVSESFARKNFVDGQALGKRVRLCNAGVWDEVVGIVNDLRERGPAQEPVGQLYEPVAQRPIAYGAIIYRLGQAQAVPRSVLRKEMDAIDPDLPFSDMKEPMDYYWLSAIGSERFAVVLFGVFSGIAVLLSAMGIYGVVSYGVAQRTREIGIRIALGAQARDILRLVFSQTGRMVGMGVLLGLGGAVASARLVESLLYQVGTLDPWSLAAVPAGMALVAILACWLPARRATAVSPITALRAE